MDKRTGKLAYACGAMVVGAPTAAGAPGRKLLAGQQHLPDHVQDVNIEAQHSHHHGHHHGHGQKHSRLWRKLQMAAGNGSLDGLAAAGRQLQDFTRADLGDSDPSTVPSTGSMGVPLLHR